MTSPSGASVSRPSFSPNDDSILDHIQTLSPEDERRAARVVALHSTSTEDCRAMLDLLGLTFTTGSVGSYYTEPGSIT